MGFLQHDTNNILLDAVLTDTGRQFLAKNDGSFSIIKFALGDDEVDYTIIKKYGRTIGKEKIEKNTPIFEALTNTSYAQKYRLISISNPNLIRLPNLALTGQITQINLSRSTSTNSTSTTSVINVEQTINTGERIDDELSDQHFYVELNNMFLQVANFTPENIDGQQKATFILARSGTTTTANGAKLTFTISLKNITDAQFDIYGQSSNGKKTIKTYVRITGGKSGSVLEIPVLISNS